LQRGGFVEELKILLQEKNSFVEVYKNLIKYKFENNFV